GRRSGIGARPAGLPRHRAARLNPDRRAGLDHCALRRRQGRRLAALPRSCGCRAAARAARAPPDRDDGKRGAAGPRTAIRPFRRAAGASRTAIVRRLRQALASSLKGTIFRCYGACVERPPTGPVPPEEHRELMRSPRNALLLLAAIALSAAPALSAAGAAPTAPHRASYVLTLKSAKSGSGIADVKGRMLFEIVDACDGWTVNQRLELRMLSNEAPELVTETSYTSWESKDGLRFRFDSRTTRNGVLAEEFRGSAELVDLESGGEATYTVPEQRKLKLPKGTLFPTAHTEAVIQRAAEGES